jgi:Tol biopolymer transport system component
MIAAASVCAASACAASAACSSFAASAAEEEAGSDAAIAAPDAHDDVSRPDGAVGSDAAPDASCDLDAAWGPVVQIVAAAGTGGDTHATLSDDELTICFDHLIVSPSREAIFTAQRTQIGDTFQNASEVSFSGPTDSEDPALAPDGLSLFFTSNRITPIDYDLWVITRPSITSAFLGASRLAVSSTSQERTPSLSPSGDLWFASDRGGATYEIYEAPRLDGGGYGSPVAVAAVSSPANEVAPVHSRDGLTVMFASDRTGGSGQSDVWTANRPDPAAELGPPSPVTALNSANGDLPAWMSPDSCRIYLSSDRGGSFRIYVSSRVK